MNKIEIESENEFNCMSSIELFEYLLDNLLISPDEEFSFWRHYKGDMRNMGKEFYREHNINKELNYEDKSINNCR